MKPKHAAKASITPRQADLFDAKAELLLPQRLELKGAVHGNPAQGFAFLEHKRPVHLSECQKSGERGYVARCVNDEAFLSAQRRQTPPFPATRYLSYRA